MIIPLIQPPDGFTSMERIFIRDILVSIYKNLNSPISKFIIVSYFECGYTQEQIASMLGISQEAVNKRIKNIQLDLRERNIFADLM